MKDQLFNYIINIAEKINSNFLRTKQLQQQREIIDAELQGLAVQFPKNNRTYIVYGGKNLYKVKSCARLLEENLSVEPVYFTSTTSARYTTSSSLELSKGCSAAIILLNPDEEESVRNKIFLELGYLLATPGIAKRIMIIHKSDFRVPADYYGVPRATYQNHLKETLLELSTQFKIWGFPVTHIQ